MTSVRLRRIGVMSLAIWLSLIAWLFGLLFGIVFGLFSFDSFSLRYGFIYILRWVFLTPIVFAVIGFIAAVVGGALYNYLVRNRGGIILDFEDIKAGFEPPPPPP